MAEFVAQRFWDVDGDYLDVEANPDMELVTMRNVESKRTATTALTAGMIRELAAALLAAADAAEGK